MSFIKPQAQRMQMGQTAAGPVDANNIMMNLCPIHFPEPIIMFKDRPLCKICIQEQFAEQMAKTGAKSNQAMGFAKEIATNVHQTEKQKIMRGLARINDFKKNFRYMHEDINQREEMSEEYMRILTPLMESMFNKLEELTMHSEQKFKNKIFQIVRN